MCRLLLILLALITFGCKTPEARKPVSVKSGSFIDASVERNKKLNALEYETIEKKLKAENKDYLVSDSGFWYYYDNKIESDSLITPGFGDLVNYDYNVKTLNGKVIYSAEELKTQNYRMDKEELFSGLREGLKLMKTGEVATFYFPSQKAYGYYGDENKIGTNIPLVCKVSINSIRKSE